MEDFDYKPKQDLDEIVFDPRFGYLTQRKRLKKIIGKTVSQFTAKFYIFLLISYALASIPAFFMGVKGALTGDFNISWEMLYSVTALASILGLYLPFKSYLKEERAKGKSLLKFKPYSVKKGLILVFASMAVIYLINIPMGLLVNFMSESGLDGSQGISESPKSVWGILLFYFSAVIIPAVIEEFALRGVVLTKLRKHGDVFAIAVSSFLFAILHMNFQQTIAIFFVGLIFGYVYVKTNNLIYPILLHFINNFVGITQVTTYTLLEENMANIISTTMFMIVLVLGLACLVMVIKNKDYKIHDRNKIQALSFGERFSAAICTPITLSFIILAVITIVLTVIAPLFS